MNGCFKYLVALAAVAASLVPAGPANAQLFGYFKFETESEIVAGLDQPTRDLIASLAPQARKEAIQFLAEALPLADKSVLLYLNRVDDIIQSRINQAVCAGQAVAGGAADEVRAVITGSPPMPILNLVKQYENRETEFASRPLTYISVSYEDFLGRAAITGCRVNEPEARKRIDTLRVLARERWKVWNDSETLCTTPEQCVDARYKKLRTLIQGSDPRDLKVSEAEKQSALIQLLPPSPRGIIQRLFPSKDRVGPWIAFEQELLKVQRVEASLYTARNLRLAFAGKALRDALNAVIEGEAAIAAAKLAISASDPASNAQAVRSAALGLGKADPARALLVVAEREDSSLAPKADEARARIEAIVSSKADIEKKVAANNAAIQAAAVEREQARLEAQIRRAEARERREPR